MKTKYYKPRISYINWFKIFGDANVPPTVIPVPPNLIRTKHITDKKSIHSRDVNRYFKQRMKHIYKRSK